MYLPDTGEKAAAQTKKLDGMELPVNNDTDIHCAKIIKDSINKEIQHDLQVCEVKTVRIGADFSGIHNGRLYQCAHNGNI